MDEANIGFPEAEAIAVLTRSIEFRDKLSRVLSGSLLYHWESVPDEPLRIEKEFGACPSLVVVDGAWLHSPEDWAEIKTWPLKKELDLIEDDYLALPASVRAVSRLHGYRLRFAWKDCIIIVVLAQHQEPWCSQLYVRQGADRVVSCQVDWGKEFIRMLSKLRNDRRLRELPGRVEKLKVLVAENTVDVFLLLDALFGDFCEFQMALDDLGESLRDTQILSAESVDRDFRNGRYDAVIIDMALSVRQEDFAVRHLERNEAEHLAEQDTRELLGIVNDNLDGLAAVKRLRKISNRIPVCVFSNYIYHRGFRNMMRRYWGSRVYDSIAVFSKSPYGRSGLGEWLSRYAGLNRTRRTEKAPD